jgi:hypothetical protein
VGSGAGAAGGGEIGGANDSPGATGANELSFVAHGSVTGACGGGAGGRAGGGARGSNPMEPEPIEPAEVNGAAGEVCGSPHCDPGCC